jgi:hypothetical protein
VKHCHSKVNGIARRERPALAAGHLCNSHQSPHRRITASQPHGSHLPGAHRRSCHGPVSTPTNRNLGEQAREWLSTVVIGPLLSGRDVALSLRASAPSEKGVTHFGSFFEQTRPRKRFLPSFRFEPSPILCGVQSDHLKPENFFKISPARSRRKSITAIWSWSCRGFYGKP